jgi:hypothetical protein
MNSSKDRRKEKQKSRRLSTDRSYILDRGLPSCAPACLLNLIDRPYMQLLYDYLTRKRRSH